MRGYDEEPSYGSWGQPVTLEREIDCYTCARRVAPHERRRRVVEGQVVCTTCCYVQGFRLDPARLS